MFARKTEISTPIKFVIIKNSSGTEAETFTGDTEASLLRNMEKIGVDHFKEGFKLMKGNMIIL